MTIQRTPSASTLGGARSHSKVLSRRENINANVILSKMIPDRTGLTSNTPFGNQGLESMGIGGLGYLQDISEQTATSIEDAENLYALLPEIELGTQILIALVLSPRDFISTELNYTFPPNLLPPDMVSAMLAIIEKNFDENGYNIKAKLPDILRKAMFREGSYPLAVIPENSIDDIINGKSRTVLESLGQHDRMTELKGLSKPLGYLGSNKRQEGSPPLEESGAMALEDLMGSLSFKARPANFSEKMEVSKWGELKGFVAPMVYDNPGVLKLPGLMNRVKQVRTQHAMESMEANVSKLYHDPDYRDQMVVTVGRVSEGSRPTVGHPLVMRMPAEAVIPVHVPGDPSNHIGYFILCDAYGNPVDRALQSDYYRSLTGNLTSEAHKLSTMLQNANQAEANPDAMARSLNTQQAIIAFSQVAERDLQMRLINGAVGANVTISKQMTAYRIMLARSLASMQTRVLYLSVDMMTYWAYDYNDNGTGRSFLENNKILTAARGLLLFAHLNAHLRNAIDHRTLDIQADPNDPHPQNTRNKIVEEWARNKSNSLPWATGNPKRMMEYVQLSGTNVNMTGAEGYPETKLDIVDRNIEQSVIDLDFDNELKRRQLMSFGVAPELFDLTTNIEFSSKMVTSNALSTKRAIALQDTTVQHLRDFQMKFCLNSSIMMDALKKVAGEYSDKLSKEIKEKGEMYVVLLFLSKFQVALPRPNVGIGQQLQDFNEFVDAVDRCLEVIFNDQAYVQGIVGVTNAEIMGAVKQSMRLKIIRAYAKSEGFMTEVFDILDLSAADSEGTKTITESMELAKIVSHITKAVGMQMRAMAVVNENQWTHIMKEIDKVKLTDAEEPDMGAGGGSGGGGDSFSSDSSDGYDDDLFGDTPSDSNDELSTDMPEDIPDDNLSEPEPTPEDSGTSSGDQAPAP